MRDHLPMRSRLSAVTAAVALLGAVATSPPTYGAQAGSGTDATLAVSRTSAIVGETLRFTGKVPASRARPVVLQRRTRDGWTRVARGTTTARGRFALVA